MTENKLTAFLNGLFEGSAIVAGDLDVFTEEDLAGAVSVLQKYYERSLHDLPDGPPAFDKEAARWASKYIYRAFQLVLLRQLDASNIEQELKDYTLPLSAEAVYSADITFRNLPLLFSFAKSLAPDDPLVMKIKETALLWPFSSVSMDLGDAVITSSIIQSHPFLKTVYADRIIESRDLKRAMHDAEKELVLTALGDYKKELWPDFETSLMTENHGK